MIAVNKTDLCLKYCKDRTMISQILYRLQKTNRNTQTHDRKCHDGKWQKHKTNTLSVTPQIFISVICMHPQVAARVSFGRSEQIGRSVHATVDVSRLFPWRQHLAVHLHQVVKDTNQHTCRMTKNENPIECSM